MGARYRITGVLLAAMLLVPAWAALAEPQVGPPPKPKPGPTARMPGPGTIVRQGDAYCFDRPATLGNIAVAGGRCYTFYLLRNSAGSFLGFGPPGPPMIPPGQIVRLNTPAGAKMNGRLFYTVPLPRPITTIPIGSMRFADVRIVWEGGRFVFHVLGITEEANQRDLEMPFMQR